jgi:hypothetical protein
MKKKWYAFKQGSLFNIFFLQFVMWFFFNIWIMWFFTRKYKYRCIRVYFWFKDDKHVIWMWIRLILKNISLLDRIWSLWLTSLNNKLLSTNLYVYVIWMWIDWYRKYQPAEPEYEVWWRVSKANESQTSYSVEQADIFQYQSYSHSDDMFIQKCTCHNSW